MLKDAPSTLAKRNGLWEAIMAVSDAILVDSATDRVTTHGFLRPHWETAIPRPTGRTILVKPLPVRVGEHDVDTIIHILFTRHGGPEVFEGMCNPPGGDWSGVSLQVVDRSLELRWLSLPRVSGTDTKRPDHVFQVFVIAPKPIILSVESKETPGTVEPRIGPRLSKYIASLMASPASIERPDLSQQWRHSTRQLNPNNFIFASAAAFISDQQSQIDSVFARAQADLILAYTFQNNGKTCDIRLVPGGRTGSIIADYASRLDLSGSGISIRIG